MNYNNSIVRRDLTRCLSYVRDSFRIDSKNVFNYSTNILNIPYSLDLIGFVTTFSSYFNLLIVKG